MSGNLQCGVTVGAAEGHWYEGRRCMEPLSRHANLDHEYVSLAVPCTDCDAAIWYSRGEWRDSGGGTVHTANPSYI